MKSLLLMTPGGFSVVGLEIQPLHVSLLTVSGKAVTN